MTYNGADYRDLVMLGAEKNHWFAAEYRVKEILQRRDEVISEVKWLASTVGYHVF